MRVYRGLSADLSPESFRAPAVTIGVYDGVHRGHRPILDELVAWAAADGGEAVVLTFDPHPRLVVTGSAPPAISTLDQRIELFAEAGVGATVVIPFDRKVAALSAEEFVEQVLVARMGARKVLVGEDHHFGHDRRGDRALLERMGRERGFEVRAHAIVTAAAGLAVSSTEVRRAIGEGDLARAGELLGRRFAVRGPVVHGDGRGRSIGVPTANVACEGQVVPPAGVYAALARLPREPAEPVRRAAVNIGVRPTFTRPAPVAGAGAGGGGGAPAPPVLVEAHLLDFAGDLYGHALELAFVARLREERRFPTVADLAAQIERDRARAAEVLAAAAPEMRGEPAARR